MTVLPPFAGVGFAVEMSLRSVTERWRPELLPDATGVGTGGIAVGRAATSRDVGIRRPLGPVAPVVDFQVTTLEATGCDAVASGRPRTASTGITLAAAAAAAAPPLGANVTCPELVVAARTVVIA